MCNPANLAHVRCCQRIRKGNEKIKMSYVNSETTLALPLFRTAGSLFLYDSVFVVSLVQGRGCFCTVRRLSLV